MPLSATNYPFVPRSINQIEEGQFWEIPLEDGLVGCGIVASTTSRVPFGFIAGILRWSGAEQPSRDDLAGITELVGHGLAGVRTIRMVGSAVLGKRDLTADPVTMIETVTSRAPCAWVQSGHERLRPATDCERWMLPLEQRLDATALVTTAKLRLADVNVPSQRRAERFETNDWQKLMCACARSTSGHDACPSRAARVWLGSARSLATPVPVVAHR